MGPSHGIYGGIGAAHVNRRYTVPQFLITVTLFFLLALSLSITHTHTRENGLHKQKLLIHLCLLSVLCTPTSVSFRS
jgi:hypothetical protein